MCKSTGIVGSCTRVCLVVLNLLLFTMGALIFSISAILKWNPDFIVDKITDDAIQSVLNVSSLNNVAVVLMSVGALLVLIGLVGFIGAICASKFFLVFYELLLVFIFITHGLSLFILTFKSSDIENQFRKELNNTVDAINNPNTTISVFKEKCKLMKALSSVFECCGSNGPQDFLNTTFVEDCCVSKVYVGCGDKLVDTLKTNGIEIILIPNMILLGIELLLILIIPCLIFGIHYTKDLKNREQNNERVNYLRPTTEFRKSYGSLKYYNE